jgi:hypothetical protein
MLDPVEFGKAMASIVREATAPLLKRIEQLEKGESGPAGKDCDPLDVARALLDSEELASAIELRVKEEVSKLPPPEKGEPGPQGPKGDPGKDGAGIQDLLIDRDGQLVATFSDGRTKSLGVVIGRDGAPGRDGKDGADFTEVRFEYDGERTLKAIGKGGEIVYRLPIPIDRGYWRAGKYEQGDIATEGGTAYIALRETDERPAQGCKDWRILARKGRDGKDGRNGIDKTAPVPIKKKDDGNA